MSISEMQTILFDREKELNAKKDQIDTLMRSFREVK